MLESRALFGTLTVLALSELMGCGSSDTGDGASREPKHELAGVCDGSGCIDGADEADGATDRCPGPYTVERPDGECVWSCGEGTTPDAASNECICKPGLVERGTDGFGRRVCRKS